MSAVADITPAARRELRAARDYYESLLPGLDVRFVNAVVKAIDTIADFPLSFESVSDEVRAYKVKRFPYIVYYKSDGVVLSIISVAHQSRRNRPQ